MVDAARIADELRQEQEYTQNLDADRKILECQVKDMQQRLDDAICIQILGVFLLLA